MERGTDAFAGSPHQLMIPQSGKNETSRRPCLGFVGQLILLFVTPSHNITPHHGMTLRRHVTGQYCSCYLANHPQINNFNYRQRWVGLSPWNCTFPGLTHVLLLVIKFTLGTDDVLRSFNQSLEKRPSSLLITH